MSDYRYMHDAVCANTDTAVGNCCEINDLIMEATRKGHSRTERSVDLVVLGTGLFCAGVVSGVLAFMLFNAETRANDLKSSTEIYNRALQAEQDARLVIERWKVRKNNEAVRAHVSATRDAKNKEAEDGDGSR